MVTLAAIILVTVLFKGLVGRLSIVIGVVVGYVVAALSGQVDLSKVSEVPWVGLPTFTAPAFDPGSSPSTWASCPSCSRSWPRTSAT